MGFVSLTASQNIVATKFVYKIKRDADGHIQRYKTRLVAKGYLQTPGVNYGETYSLVIKPTSIRLVLTLVITHR